MNQEKIGMKGRCFVCARDAGTGKLVLGKWFDNLIVTTGRVHVAELLGGYPRRPSHIAVGTGATAPVAGNTTLGTEVFRKIITRRRSPSAPNNYKIIFQMFLTTAEANGNTLTEAGIFNRAALGSMLSRVTYTGIAKTSSITVTYTWEISITTV